MQDIDQVYFIYTVFLKFAQGGIAIAINNFVRSTCFGSRSTIWLITLIYGYVGIIIAVIITISLILYVFSIGSSQGWWGSLLIEREK